MEKKNKLQFYSLGLVILGLVIGLTFGFSGVLTNNMSMNMDNMPHHRESFISQRDSIMGKMMAHGEYACCLKKPCTYCIEKTPGHGEGASCHCLEDIVNGKHPCGECIGEILEGHGNPLLAEYFAQAIAEEVGDQHLGTLQQIISEKYDIEISSQI